MRLQTRANKMSHVDYPVRAREPLQQLLQRRMCVVCCVLCCTCVCCVVLLSPLWLLLCFWCGEFRASKYTGVPLSVSGYLATLFYPKTRPIPAGFGVVPESCRVLDWFSGFRLTGPNPTSHSTHTQHSSSTTTRASHITHHTSHITHHTQHTRMDICLTFSSASGGSWKQRR